MIKNIISIIKIEIEMKAGQNSDTCCSHTQPLTTFAFFSFFYTFIKDINEIFLMVTFNRFGAIS